MDEAIKLFVLCSFIGGQMLFHLYFRRRSAKLMVLYYRHMMFKDIR